VKILIYGVNYSPELTGVGKYSGEMAAWLAEKGHDVRVVTAPPYYPEWKVSHLYVNAYKREFIDGVEVFRCPLYVPVKPSGIKRIVHLASFALSSFPVMLKQILWRPDVIVVIEPPLFCAPTAWLIARVSSARCWLHVQDFEVDAAFDLGIIPFSWMKKFVLFIESWLMRRFDKVSTISNSMMQRLQQKGVGNPVFFPNWADFSKIQYDKQGRKEFRTEFCASSEQCLCLYSGNIAVKQGLDILLEVASSLPDYLFVICGDGVNKKALQAQAGLKELQNIVFIPLQPLEKLSALLSAADIHLVIQKSGAADLVLPSKLTNILAMGGAAVVTAEENTELGQLAQGDYACVYRCDPEQEESLAGAIVRLHQDKKLLNTVQVNAKKYAHEYIASEKVLKTWEKEMLDLLL